MHYFVCPSLARKTAKSRLRLKLQVQHTGKGKTVMGTKYEHLRAEERAVIMLERQKGRSFQAIGRMLNRDRTTISALRCGIMALR